MAISKAMKHIKQHTYNIDACDIKKIRLTADHQIYCVYEMDGLEWRGEIQKIYLDKNGEAISYDVYLY